MLYTYSKKAKTSCNVMAVFFEKSLPALAEIVDVKKHITETNKSLKNFSVFSLLKNKFMQMHKDKLDRKLTHNSFYVNPILVNINNFLINSYKLRFFNKKNEYKQK